MTKLRFTKMHGAGNDLVVLDGLRAPLPAFDPAVPKEPADPEALEALTAQWGLRSSVDRVRTAFGWA